MHQHHTSDLQFHGRVNCLVMFSSSCLNALSLPNFLNQVNTSKKLGTITCMY